jgi:hypothetical protein
VGRAWHTRTGAISRDIEPGLAGNSGAGGPVRAHHACGAGDTRTGCGYVAGQVAVRALITAALRPARFTCPSRVSNAETHTCAVA